MKDPTRPVRCAIYTRKSSDEGLDQQFTSLDAQRQACEAMVTSKKSLGWNCVSARYDDGGYSGGNVERPGLRRLIADVERGEIDAIVVYRLDRLTRSIKDFGTLMDVLNKHQVSLASVSESLDTATAPGRLMVHLLLSFAQYERELASERTRDKISASRRRGIWTGGRPVLGYTFKSSTLTVDPEEAVLVRSVFDLYLELRSISAVLAELSKRGIVNKAWTTKAGRRMGGLRFHKSTLHLLLTNPIYIGRVPHREKTFAGQHKAIVDADVFARVQALLSENGRSGASLTRNTHGGLLKGLLRCGCCETPMVHTTTRGGKGAVHRYYSCRSRQVVGPKRCTGGLVPAGQIEDFVLEKVRTGFAEPELITLVLDVARAQAESRIRDIEARKVLAAQDAAGDPRMEMSSAARVRDLESEIDAVRAAIPDRAMVEAGVESFEQVWCSLCPTERARLLSLVVEGVTFDSKQGTVAIKLHDQIESATECST